jgi:ABC-type multidrug transport system ATPase subunit
MDDPLSAVDAHVGKALFEHAILGLRDHGKSVLLVTHALHFIPQTDYIYAVENGRIMEEGTYDELIDKDGPFSKLMKEFGGEGTADEEEPTGQIILDNDTKAQEKRDLEVKGAGKNRYQISHAIGKAAGTGKLEGRLIQSEKRTTGSVSRKSESTSTGVIDPALLSYPVFLAYTAASKGWLTVPVILLMAVLMQCMWKIWMSRNRH